MIDVGALRATVTLDAGDFKRGADEVRQDLQRTQEEANKTSSAFENLGKVMDGLRTRQITNLGRSLSIAVTAPVVILGKELLDAAVKMDSFSRGMTSINHSAAETAVQLESLKKAANIPGLGFEDAVKGSIALQATGESAAMAERELKAFGNALAQTGKGKAELENVVQVLTHIHSLTYLSNREIRSLSFNIPQTRATLLQLFGTSEGKELKAQGITAAQVMQGLITEFEKIDKVSSGAKNEIDNFFDHLFQDSAKVGQSLLPVVTTIIHHVGPAVHWLAETFANLSVQMKTIIVSFFAFAAVIGPPILALGLFARAVQDLRIGLGEMAKMGAGISGWFRGVSTAATENTAAEEANAAATTKDATAKAAEADILAAKTKALAANTAAAQANTEAEEANAVATTADAEAEQAAMAAAAARSGINPAGLAAGGRGGLGSLIGGGAGGAVAGATAGVTAGAEGAAVAELEQAAAVVAGAGAAKAATTAAGAVVEEVTAASNGAIAAAVASIDAETAMAAVAITEAANASAAAAATAAAVAAEEAAAAMVTLSEAKANASYSMFNSGKAVAAAEEMVAATAIAAVDASTASAEAVSVAAITSAQAIRNAAVAIDPAGVAAAETTVAAAIAAKTTAAVEVAISEALTAEAEFAAAALTEVQGARAYGVASGRDVIAARKVAETTAAAAAEASAAAELAVETAATTAAQAAAASVVFSLPQRVAAEETARIATAEATTAVGVAKAAEEAAIAASAVAEEAAVAAASAVAFAVKTQAAGAASGFGLGPIGIAAQKAAADTEAAAVAAAEAAVEAVSVAATTAAEATAKVLIAKDAVIAARGLGVGAAGVGAAAVGSGAVPAPIGAAEVGTEMGSATAAGGVGSGAGAGFNMSQDGIAGLAGAGALGAGAAAAGGGGAGAAGGGGFFTAAGAAAVARKLRLGRAIPGMQVLMLAYAAHMAKEMMPADKDEGILQKHGEGGLLADIATGALAGGVAGGAVGSLFGPVGSLAGVAIGAIGGGFFGAHRFLSGEKERVAQENAKREADTLSIAKAESEQRKRQKMLDDLLKPDEGDFAESEDAKYHADLARAHAEAREESSATPVRAQYEASKPVMEERAKVLQGRMKELEPTIKTDAEDAKNYYKAQAEYWGIEDNLAKMAVASGREREQIQKKTFHDQKEVADAQFRAMQYAAQSLAESAPEGKQAQTFAREAGPLIEKRQKELADDIKRLQPESAVSAEAAKEYWSDVQEYWQLEEHKQQLNRAGAAEAKRTQDKAARDEREAHLAQIAATMEWGQTLVAGVEKTHQYRAAVSTLLPILKGQQQELLQELSKQKAGSAEYWKIVKEYWQLEREGQEMGRNANAEVETEKKKAETEAKKARHEKLQTMELRERLTELSMENDPLVDDRTAKRRLVPMLLQQYREMLKPIEGETEIERLQREIEAQTLKKKIITDAGLGRKGYARTLEGGVIPLFDRALAQQVQAGFAEAEKGHLGGAGISSSRGTAQPGPKRSYSEQEILEYLTSSFRAGKTDPALRQAAAAYQAAHSRPMGRDEIEQREWEGSSENIRPTRVIDARSGRIPAGYISDPKTGGYSTVPTATQTAAAAAGGKTVILQIILPPHSTKQERESAIRRTLQEWSDQTDPSPTGRPNR